MRRILSSVFSLYWALIFAIMAFGIVRVQSGLDDKLLTKVFDFIFPLAERASTAILFGAGFAFASIVFIWASAASAIAHSDPDGDCEDIMHKAFAVGATVLLGSLVVAVIQNQSGAFWSLAFQIGVLAACYAAVVAESRHAQIHLANKRKARERIASRMARGAAHESMLPTILSVGHGRNGVNK